MKTPDLAMSDLSTTGVILVSSAASCLTLVLVLAVCICCLQIRKKGNGDETDSDYEEEDPTTYLPSDKKDDVRPLHKHSWKERLQKPKFKAPLLTRKSIQVEGVRFEGPARQKMVTETVQPDTFSQTSLNRSLGVRSQGSLSRGDSVDSRDGAQAEGGSSSNSGVGGILGTPKFSLSSAFKFDDTGPPDVVPHEPEGARENLGKIQFTLQYDFQEMTPNLRIIRAVELPAKDFSGTSDPYVKIYLLPDRKQKLETKIKRKNLNPRWNEIFAFEGFPFAKIQNKILYLQVLDYDRFSRDDPIGEVLLPLSDVDLGAGATMWKSLLPCKGGTGKLGELLLSLCYQPTVGRITIVIMKARELKAKDVTGSSDPYVKIWLMHEGKRVEKKKTAIHPRTLNPVFNESFIFTVPYDKIRQTSLNISVMDYDRMGRNDLIGQVSLSSRSGPMEVKHWNEMLSKARQPVAQWHLLKDFR